MSLDQQSGRRGNVSGALHPHPNERGPALVPAPRTPFFQALTGAVATLLLQAPRVLSISRARLPGAGQGGAPARLDPQIALLLFLAKLRRLSEVRALGPQGARTLVAKTYNVIDARTLPMARVEDLWFPSGAGACRARLYIPHGTLEPAPAFIYFHGGGWATGSVDTHDRQVRLLAHEAQAVALSVDYRLAPEHPFPAAVEDAWAAYRWLADNAAALRIDRTRIALAGDSAGGNLAAVVAQLAAERGPVAPRCQLLIYPIVDLTQASESYRLFAEGYVLTRRSMDFYIELYLGAHGDRRDPRASPVFAPELAGVAPALIVTAGYDPLRDEAQRYAERLEGAGVRVQYVCHGGLVHGFLAMTGAVHAARSAVLDMAHRLRAELA